MRDIQKLKNNYNESKSKLTTYLWICIENSLKNQFAKENSIKMKCNLPCNRELQYDDFDLIECLPSNVDIEKEIIDKETNEKLYEAIEKIK